MHMPAGLMDTSTCSALLLACPDSPCLIEVVSSVKVAQASVQGPQDHGIGCENGGVGGHFGLGRGR